MGTSTVSIDALILARVIVPEKPGISPGVAEELLKLGFSEDDHKRMSELAEKARQGTLTPEERAETEGFERVSSFLGFLKSKARKSKARVSRKNATAGN